MKDSKIFLMKFEGKIINLFKFDYMKIINGEYNFYLRDHSPLVSVKEAELLKNGNYEFKGILEGQYTTFEKFNEFMEFASFNPRVKIIEIEIDSLENSRECIGTLGVNHDEETPFYETVQQYIQSLVDKL